MENYKLEFTRQAEEALAKIARYDRALYSRLVNVLDSLEKDPFTGKPLKGELKGLYSYRISSFRIIYKVYRQALLVIVVDIGHRREIYR